MSSQLRRSVAQKPKIKALRCSGHSAIHKQAALRLTCGRNAELPQPRVHSHLLLRWGSWFRANRKWQVKPPIRCPGFSAFGSGITEYPCRCWFQPAQEARSLPEYLCRYRQCRSWVQFQHLRPCSPCIRQRPGPKRRPSCTKRRCHSLWFYSLVSSTFSFHRFRLSKCASRIGFQVNGAHVVPPTLISREDD